MPLYMRLREARHRNIKLNAQEMNLVDIRTQFEEIKKNEDSMNIWLQYLKSKVKDRTARELIERNQRIQVYTDTPVMSFRKSNSTKRKSYKRLSNISTNHNLSMLVHRDFEGLNSSYQCKSLKQNLSQQSTRESLQLRLRKLLSFKKSQNIIINKRVRTVSSLCGSPQKQPLPSTRTSRIYQDIVKKLSKNQVC